MKNNITDKILFEEQCVIDEAKIFYFEGRVLRAIYNDEQAELYRKILTDGTLNAAFESGLVKTKIADDIIIDGCSLVVEHEQIDFFLHPVEMTSQMFYNCALTFVRIAKNLAAHKLILKDAHPWNLTYHKGKPVFFDFASIGFSNQYHSSWVDQFFTYFAVPLKLASSKWNDLAVEYRRQHTNGFGVKLSGKKKFKQLFFNSFISISKQLDNTDLYLQKLEHWIEKQKPETITGEWDNYEQGHNTRYDNPVTLKQNFVYNILKKCKPARVIDLAANKGYYGFMAEHLGAKVIAFDYEEFCVDEANKLIADKNITFCQMNFTLPTPAYGWALIGPGAYSRFKSDIALALGLIHHVCLVQKFPVKLFCDICAQYSKKGVVIEFVFPEDKHVKSWDIIIPPDYSIEALKSYFSKQFNKIELSDMMNSDEIKRQFLFFYND